MERVNVFKRKRDGKTVVCASWLVDLTKKESIYC